MEQRLAISGRVRANRMLQVPSRIEGTVIAVPVSDGMPVLAGQILAVLEAREYRAAFERSRTALLGAQIEYATLSSSPFRSGDDSLRFFRLREAVGARLQEVRQEFAAGKMSDENLARLTQRYEAEAAYYSADRSDVIAYKSGLSAAVEAFERAQRDLEQTTIRAAFDGLVANLSASPGIHLRPGDPVCTLVDPSSAILEADVLETEIERIRPGQRAVMTTVTLPAIPLRGRVETMNPVIDDQAHAMRIRIRLDGPAQRGNGRWVVPGMYATGTVEAGTLKDRLVVPRAALLERDQRSLVFVIEHAAARWRYVERGDENDEVVEIIRGLKPGDSVITDGHFSLVHDAKVQVVR
jgi:RND family efflux transporter MFP subunit